MSRKESFRTGNRHGLLLYDFGASPCARRCRITLVEKGLCWDTATIDLSRIDGQRFPGIGRWLEAIRRRPAVEANPCAAAPVIRP